MNVKLPAVLSNIKLPFVRSKEAIGVDIGNYTIKIAQLKYSMGKWNLLRYASEPVYTPPDTTAVTPAEKKQIIVNAIRKLISKNNITTKYAATSVSGNSVIVRYIKLPKLTQQQLAKTIKVEAESYIPFPIQDVNIGFQIIGDAMEDGEQKMETLVVATKKEIIQQRIEILVEAGLIPVVIDVDSFAVENAISINLSEEDLRKTFLVVNCGVQTTNIIIIEKGKSRVVRDVFIAGETFTKMLQRNLQTNWKQAEENKIKYGISEPAAPLSEDDVSGPLQQQVASLLSASVKELVSEIQRSIDYYQTQGAASDKHIDRIFLCGGTMLMKGIAGYVESKIKLPVTIFNPFTKIAPGNTPVSDPEFTFAQYAVAVGLATRSKGDTEK